MGGLVGWLVGCYVCLCISMHTHGEFFQLQLKAIRLKHGIGRKTKPEVVVQELRALRRWHAGDACRR